MNNFERMSEQLAQPATAGILAVATGGTSLVSWLEYGTTLLGFLGALFSCTLAFLLLLNYLRRRYFRRRKGDGEKE